MEIAVEITAAGARIGTSYTRSHSRVSRVALPLQLIDLFEKDLKKGHQE